MQQLHYSIKGVNHLLITRPVLPKYLKDFDKQCVKYNCIIVDIEIRTPFWNKSYVIMSYLVPVDSAFEMQNELT